MFAISSLVLFIRNSSLMAQRVATVTAADDPRPDELGIWELMYTLPTTPIASKQPSIYGDLARWARLVSRTVTNTRGFMAMAMPGFPYTTACSPNKNTLPGALHVANLDHRNTGIPHDFPVIPGHISAGSISDKF